MSCLGVRVRAISLVLTVLLIAGFSAPVYAQEGEAQPELITAPGVSPNGVYAVVGTTSTGRQVNVNVLVTSLADDRIQFKTRVLGIPVTTSGVATWSADRTEATVPISVYIFMVADASGSVTLSAGSGGWDFVGSGSGKAMGASGTATATGFMPGGVEPPPTLVGEATGVLEVVQSADSALSTFRPAAAGDIDSSDQIAVLTALLFLIFIAILLLVINRSAI